MALPFGRACCTPASCVPTARTPRPSLPTKASQRGNGPELAERGDRFAAYTADLDRQTPAFPVMALRRGRSLTSVLRLPPSAPASSP